MPGANPPCPQMPAFISLRYEPNGAVSAVAQPLPGKQEANRLIGVLRAGRRVGVIFAKACRDLVHKFGANGVAGMQLGNERCNGLCGPNTQADKSLRVRIGFFIHLVFLHARRDKRHGTVGGTVRKHDVAGCDTSSQDAA